jgi:SAM-dependent methyltransferase
MKKDALRSRLYKGYVSDFKEAVSKSNSGDSASARRYRAYLSRRLSPWLSDVKKDALFADLGCGDGMLIRVFRDMGYHNIVGVEGCKEMHERCKEVLPTVELGDLRQFLYGKKAYFDVIALFDVLEHFTREEAAELLDQIALALRPNGLLLLQLPNGDSPFAMAVFAGDTTHEALYTTGSLTHLLATAGLSLEYADEHSPEAMDMRSTLRWVLWKGIRSLLALYHRIETGGPSTGIYTRVMRIGARKPINV